MWKKFTRITDSVYTNISLCPRETYHIQVIRSTFAPWVNSNPFQSCPMEQQLKTNKLQRNWARRTMINEYRMTKDRWRYSIIIFLLVLQSLVLIPYYFYCCVPCHWCFVILGKRGLNINFLHFSSLNVFILQYHPWC